MRNYLLTTLTFSLVLFISSCTKTKFDQVQSATSIQLTTDSNFIQLVKLQVSLGEFLTSVANNKGYSFDQLKDKTLSLKNKNLSITQTRNEIDKLFGDGANNFINSYNNNFKIRWDKLNQKYSTISIDNIDNACSQIFSQKKIIDFVPSKKQNITINSTTKISKIDGCGFRYYACIAAATSAAILCHGACIGGTAGFGAPLCVVLCGTVQISAGVYCIDTYCPIN